MKKVLVNVGFFSLVACSMCTQAGIVPIEIKIVYPQDRSNNPIYNVSQLTYVITATLSNNNSMYLNLCNSTSCRLNSITIPINPTINPANPSIGYDSGINPAALALMSFIPSSANGSLNFTVTVLDVTRTTPLATFNYPTLAISGGTFPSTAVDNSNYVNNNIQCEFYRHISLNITTHPEINISCWQQAQRYSINTIQIKNHLGEK